MATTRDSCARADAPDPKQSLIIPHQLLTQRARDTGFPGTVRSTKSTEFAPTRVPSPEIQAYYHLSMVGTSALYDFVRERPLPN